MEEKEFVAKLARAIAVANGHSHPDEWATSVAEAFEPTAPVLTDEVVDG